MSRQLLVKIHLYLATFFAPIVLMIAISGGLYLFGQKGQVESQLIHTADASVIDLKSASLDADVRTYFSAQGLDTGFEYLRMGTDGFTTRPTSRDYYVVRVADGQLTITEERPDLIKTIVELHKGHGPGNFKTLQKFTAFGLSFVLLSGLWIGLITPPMRKLTLLSTGAGFIVWLAFIVI